MPLLVSQTIFLYLLFFVLISHDELLVEHAADRRIQQLLLAHGPRLLTLTNLLGACHLIGGLLGLSPNL